MPTGLNPWVLLAALVLALTLFGAGYSSGYESGDRDRATVDQRAINKVNKQIDDNKKVANEQLRQSMQDVIALQRQRDEFKTNLQKEHLQNEQITDRLHAALDPVRLRFGADPAGPGPSCQNGVPCQGSPARDAGSSQVCELSAEASSALKALAYDADKMRDDFILCYDYVNGSS